MEVAQLGTLLFSATMQSGDGELTAPSGDSPTIARVEYGGYTQQDGDVTVPPDGAAVISMG